MTNMTDVPAFNVTEHNPGDGEAGILSGGGLITALWVISFLAFIFAPCCFSTRRRRIWVARFTTCKWNVDVGPEEESEVTRVARERYEAYRAQTGALEEERNNLTKQEEEEIRHLFILESMSAYTITISEDNICDRDNASTGDLEDYKGMYQVNAPKTRTFHPPDEDMPSSPASDIEEGIYAKTSDTVNDSSSNSENGNASSDDDPLAEIEADSNTDVILPVQGEPYSRGGKTRTVPNGCAICLCEFESGDRVTWSATPGDPHAFHQDCMLKYLMSVGAKASRRRRQNPENHDMSLDPVEAVLDFPMLCPCCRQTFVCQNNEHARTRLSTADTETDHTDDGSDEMDSNGTNRDSVTIDNGDSTSDDIVDMTTDSTPIDSTI